MFSSIFIAALIAVTSVACQQEKYTTPVPILKQINRHNEDGSYSYGYEAADGSFKIESKHPDGQVFGKYGYVDADGKLREIEYGASSRGFEPAGSGINVPPPTINNKQQDLYPLAPGQEDDGQYREDPSIYYKNEIYNEPARVATKSSHQSFFQQQAQPQVQPQQYYQNNVPQQQYTSAPVAQQRYYNPAPVGYTRPTNIQVNPNLFNGHPASNFDVNSGSYSIQY